ncbi:lipopolysaccharide biosynthesis protein [Succinivibrio dextrinosolvens]|uniref:lipopolysaccharide biosynthesis protein n=1 Tax=Succinivibrio dextrinosolvens TaxID=83771 RepID=UPI0004E1915B|nr:oligosaccharide flippase family protein [Succinivibrio dextrinosolvens]
MNNTEKILKNSLLSVIGQICNLIIQFINRAVFVVFLDVELLGYQSLFSNVFVFLSLAELGIGNIIAFHLYKEIVNNNKDEIGRLMCLFKWLYRIVAAIVFFLGGICYFLLPYFVKNENVSWNYVCIIYFMQLTAVILGYFLSYKRTLFIAVQQEYKCVTTDVGVAFLVQIIQLICLAIFKNYLLYLSIQLSTTIIANIIISVRCNREFPYLKNKYVITKDYIKKRNLFADMRDILFHKICYAIYGGTDNIIISAFCGVRAVALYSNYVMIQLGVMSVLFYRLLNPIQATIGNIIYSDRTKDELWKQFNMLDVFSFFFATYIGLGFLIFFQPTITLWMGRDYLLSDLFVFIFSSYIYLGAVWEIVYKYRTCFGNYKQDRFCMFLSAVLNIIISIFGAKYFGIEGVLIGTVFAFLPIAYGRIRFVVKNYFSQSILKYLLKHFILFLIAVFEGFVCYNLCKNVSVNLIGFIERGFIWLFVPLLINILIYWNNSYFKNMLNYFSRFFLIILKKIGNK